MIELTKTGKLVVLGVAVPTTAVLLYWLLKPAKDEEYDSSFKSSKAATSRQTVIELKVPRKDVGIVIGRQGSMIKQLQEETGAKLNFKDDPQGDSEERTMMIRGTPETAQAAECAVRRLLAERPVIQQAEMFVPGYAVGRIIGKGGENIRQMSRTSHAKINVDRTRENYRDKPRLITICGTTQQIEVAKSLIQETMLEEDELRARNAVAAANREVRKKSKEPKHESHGHVANTQVSSLNEVWNVQNGDGNGNHGNHVDNIATETVTGSDAIAGVTLTPFPRVPDFVEVYVSAVAHPGVFWVQRVSNMGLRLDELVLEMTRYYDAVRVSNMGLRLDELVLEMTRYYDAINETTTEIKVGDYVAAPLEGDTNWYRAKVMGVTGRELDIFYVDYGDSVFMDMARVKPLRSQFLTLPLQAIECKLTGVKSVGDWSEESIGMFEQLTHCANWKVIMARAEHFTGEVPHLTLIDTNSDTDVNINDELVRLGLAVTDTDT